ncbi:MAG: TIM barrel protein [Gemmatimonadaceae bacterium]|nr:TIM barrel protein [Gemmatimonadaceae bacterium]
MDRREFVNALGSVVAVSQLSCAGGMTARGGGTRELRRVGVQLYSLRDDARRDLERTIADIAAAGYHDVELLGSMNNFGMSPAALRQVLDRNGLRAPSTHVAGTALDNLERQLDDAQTLGHEYIVVASLPIPGTPTLADYHRWADRLNEAGRVSRERKIWIGFHNHAGDFAVIDGEVAYDVLAARTDPKVVRLQLDTGNVAMAGRDPMEYMKRFGDRYWLFHIKDIPQLGAKTDTELGKGVIDFRRLLGSIERIDEKHLFVEQETYPGAPLDSVRRDFTYISSLRF